MIRMKALKSFSGRPNEGRVKKGREFDVADERRAAELEKPPHGMPLAMRVGEKAEPGAPQNKVEPPLDNKMEPAPDNKAQGELIPPVGNTNRPLSLIGGATGPETSPSSSRRGRQQPPQESKPSGDEPES